MSDLLILEIKYLTGFVLVALAAYQVAVLLQKHLHFPLITGLIIVGILAGSSLLHYIEEDAIDKLNFITDISLAIIAFSAGAEFHLDGMRSRLKSIKWISFTSVFIGIVAGTWILYLYASKIEFLGTYGRNVHIVFALLMAVIFIARSPSSAIAIINEMRAGGPFTKTVLGVTVITDVLVIVLFAIGLAAAKSIVHNIPLDLIFIAVMLGQLVFSVLIGLLAGLLFKGILYFHIPKFFKILVLIITAYLIFILSDSLHHLTAEIWRHPMELEPLLVAVVASMYVVNYTRYKAEFEDLLETVMPYVFVLFFTLTGAGLSVQTLISVFEVALVLFGIRIVLLILGSVTGELAARDPLKFVPVSWMPYITQAGVAIGLSTLVGLEFPDWGHYFETLVIAIIVLNQIVGPPLFKWALKFVGESHKKPGISRTDKNKKAVIFSYDHISAALARSLKQKGWDVRIITTQETTGNTDIDVKHIEHYSPVYLKKLNLKGTDVFVLLHPDEKTNLRIARWLYENTDPKQIIATVKSAQFLNEFKQLKVKTLEPVASFVNMLEHSVRSPEGTALILGEKDTDTIDIEVKNKDLVGLQIRDLKLPHDIIILSLKRRNNTVLTHGYTRLRLGDILTIVGPRESLEKMMLQFESV